MNITWHSHAVSKWLPSVVGLHLALACHCAFADDDKRPIPDRNVLLFITDDEGTTLGCYDDPVAQTPNVDALAADGTRFTCAFATTASCSASRSVVLSGLHNHKNGQYGHQHHFHKFATYHNVVSLSLPRVLADAGYRTARCGKFHVAPEPVYHFETTIPGADRNVVEMAEHCREFLEDRSDDRPFLLYFATNDPHRSGKTDRTSKRELKPNLFGNLPNRGSYPGVEEVYYRPDNVVVPAFLPDTPETREELAQYYQSCARIDQGLGRLVDILKEAGLYDKTLILFTSDHGMAFAGAKTTVYEPGLHVPLVVRNPYESQRGVVSDALVSHVDLTPTLVNFAGQLDPKTNGPKQWQDPNSFWRERGVAVAENRSGGNQFRGYQGKSWLGVMGDPEGEHHDAVFASHTFHEIQMYYPMRVIRDRNYKLIWNIAHPLEYPFASDLWAASSWQGQFRQGQQAPYGQRTVGEYIHRPEFELYDIANDPDESHNLSANPGYATHLARYKRMLRERQKRLEDPWIVKWKYE